MDLIFEELDFQVTPLGDISLRRRSEPRLNGQVLYEVKLGEEFLMSSLFVEAEEQLSILGLAALKRAGFESDLDIVVGGLGLGYTAVAALESSAVQSLLVIDVMEAVIDWHKRGLLPVGDVLAANPRCQLRQGDFFSIATDKELGFYTHDPSKLAHAVLLDIDHSPTHWLNQQNSQFYTPSALQHVYNKLHSGGVFGLWSDDPHDADFMKLLDSVFDKTESHQIKFPNPYTGGESANTVYLAHKEL